jgi:hypothetical protein
LKVNSSKGNTAIGSLTMCVSVVILLAGMLAGIVMGARHFVLAPARVQAGRTSPAASCFPPA